ncbi:MAG: tripartite tricarboxylate transporter permease [Methanohalobium sp.]|uniref:tripartite tricarboxylate transporter permease n=1 Tax=Methanohalobium sp. TaxID=2837493 RepID=UPI00397C07A8
MSITMLLLSIISGYLLGIISGLIPGIHTNNFAMILLVLSPVMTDYGITTFYAAVIILANAITHTFHDVIPSIFLGAPSADMALAVLPGHQLLLDGQELKLVTTPTVADGASCKYLYHLGHD